MYFFKKYSGSFIGNVITLAGGTALAQIILFAASPLITRLYSPDEYGSFSVFFAIISILATVASFRYEVAILLPDDDFTALNILLVSIICLGFVVMAVFAVFFVLNDVLSVWLKISEQSHLIAWALAFGLLGMGLYQIFNYWGIRTRNYAQIAVTKCTQNVVLAVGQIILGIMHMGSLGLIIGDLLGRMAGTGTLARHAWVYNKETIKVVSINTISAAARRYFRFSVLSSMSALVNCAGFQLPVMLFATLYENNVAGLYSFGYRVVQAPLALIFVSVSQVYSGEAARLASHDLNKMRELFLSTAKKLFMLGLIPAGILAVLGPWLFELVFGPAWREAGVFIQIMAPALLLGLVTSPLSQTLNLLELPHWQLFWDIVRLAMVILGLTGAFYAGGSPAWAVVAYCVATSVSYILLFYLCILGIRKKALAK